MRLVRPAPHAADKSEVEVVARLSLLRYTKARIKVNHRNKNTQILAIQQ